MILHLTEIAFAGLLGSFSAHSVDLHAFWDDRCHECHGHAGAFARTFMNVEAGQLVGRHHKDDLKRFLGQHYMGPAWVESI